MTDIEVRFTNQMIAYSLKREFVFANPNRVKFDFSPYFPEKEIQVNAKG